MTIREIIINNCSYTIQCEDGKEGHLTELSLSLDRRVRMIADALNGKVSDNMLLLLSALELEDLCMNLKKQLAEISRSNELLLYGAIEKIRDLTEKIIKAG